MSSTATSTLRRNRFKPLIFSAATRSAIVAAFMSDLKPHLEAWRAGKFQDFVIVGIYWTLLLRHLRPRDYKVGATPWAAELRDLDFKTSNFELRHEARELFETPLKFRLRSSPLATHHIFYKWVQGEADLVVTEHVPTAREVLDLQCTGRRFVTLITDPELFLTEVEGRDPFSFLLHDLVHADKFLSHEELKLEQIQSYIDLRERLDAGEFTEPLKNPEFEKQFEYLISDMNSHPEHMKAYLDHIVKAAQNTGSRASGFEVLLTP